MILPIIFLLSSSPSSLYCLHRPPQHHHLQPRFLNTPSLFSHYHLHHHGDHYNHFIIILLNINILTQFPPSSSPTSPFLYPLVSHHHPLPYQQPHHRDRITIIKLSFYNFLTTLLSILPITTTIISLSFPSSHTPSPSISYDYQHQHPQFIPHTYTTVSPYSSSYSSPSTPPPPLPQYPPYQLFIIIIFLLFTHIIIISNHTSSTPPSVFPHYHPHHHHSPPNHQHPHQISPSSITNTSTSLSPFSSSSSSPSPPPP